MRRTPEYFESLEARVLLAAGNGLLGQYFNDANLSVPSFTRTDPSIDFDFGTRGPLTAVAPDTFSIRWTGQIQAPTTGTYAFRTVADDGVRLTVRGQSLIDRWSDRPTLPGDTNGDLKVDIVDLGVIATNWQLSSRTLAQGDVNGDGTVNIVDLGILAAHWQSTGQPTVSDSATISLTAGQKYDIKLEYFDDTGAASVQLLWTPPGGAEQVVPRQNFFDTYSPAPQTLNNPIAPIGADPWVLKYQDEYLYCWSDGGHVYVSRSARLQDIDTAPASLVWSPPSGTMYSKDVWAPELHQIGDKWYIYVAADDGDNANHRMYVLESNASNPQGSYTFKGKIAAATDRWAIDGTVVEYDDSMYFVWSGWPGFADGAQLLYIAEMSNPWTIGGDRAVLSTPQYPWEQSGLPINEGPEALVHNGTLNIVYSASGFWTDDYSLGLLTYSGSGSILSKTYWSKSATPVFSKTSQVVGVGHASFTQSPDGLEDWIVYHAHNDPNTWTGVRDVRAQPFTWNSDNTPNFGSPLLSVTEPSGTPHFDSSFSIQSVLANPLPSLASQQPWRFRVERLTDDAAKPLLRELI